MKIYLVGYMGSGKSTLGSDLAAVLGIQWIDLDDEFESRYKIRIADFFNKYSETAFRELEHKILSEVSSIPGFVVSTGGGTPCFHGNMELMNRTGLTIYLSASPELILSRIELTGRKRPLFQKMEGDHSLQNITEHLKLREKHYNLAQLTIDAANPDIPALKNTILKYFGFIS
jgi:shikimate kinase